MESRRAVLLLLLWSACSGHALALASATRPRMGTARCAAVLAHASAAAPAAEPAPSPLRNPKEYWEREVIRPLFMHGVIYWNALLRHWRGRAQLTRSSFDGEASRITLIGALTNLILAGFKLAAGVFGHSSAMLADAGHSFSDLLTDGVTLVTLRMSALPPDDDHPYGHGRFESLGSFVVASVLLLAAASFFSSAYSSLVAGAAAPVPGVIAVWAALSSIVSKARPSLQ